jgi:hypothetical protein
MSQWRAGGSLWGVLVGRGGWMLTFATRSPEYIHRSFIRSGVRLAPVSGVFLLYTIGLSMRDALDGLRNANKKKLSTR